MNREGRRAFMTAEDRNMPDAAQVGREESSCVGVAACSSEFDSVYPEAYVAPM